MRRGDGPKRKKALGADSAKTRDWNRRSREEAARNLQERARQKAQAGGHRFGRVRSPARRAEKPPEVPLGPLSPADYRLAAWDLAGGRSALSGRRVARLASSWVWQAHHPVPKQHLPNDRKYDPRNSMVLLTAEHMAHEYTPGARIPFEKVPARALAFAEELDREGILDQSAVELLRRYHPPAGAGTTTGGQQ